MGWYRFIEGEPLGRVRVKKMHIAWYDTENDGSCFDEDIISFDETDTNTEIFEEIGSRLCYVEFPKEKKCTKSRVFLSMENGEEFELTLRKVGKNENTSRFDSAKAQK